MAAENSAPRVAVIGGGFTGAAVAYHLAALLSGEAARITVYEPRSRLGKGLAYDTDEPVHRINVPASRMTLVPGDEGHFQRWLEEGGALLDDPGSLAAEGHVFARRSVFGRYVAAQLDPLLKSGIVDHRRSRVNSVSRTADGRWRIEADDGSSLAADIVIIAATHPSPQAPAVLENALKHHPRYVADATVIGALSKVRADDRVLLVGTGLTAADVIAALDASGHMGSIALVSRRGLRSRGHNLLAQEPYGEFVSPPEKSARRLLRKVRRTLEEAALAGVSWHAVFDRLRVQGQEIWRALPPPERRRLVRFLRPYWDVHRFRIAPQVEAVIDRGLAAGRLTVTAAAVLSVHVEDDGEIRIRWRLKRGGTVVEEHYDAVIVTTGPGHGSILKTQPFLTDLAAAGLLQPDKVGLGIAVDEESRPIGADGSPVNTLYIAGPLARGTFGELMGLPQVTEHAVLVAELAARSLSLADAEARF